MPDAHETITRSELLEEADPEQTAISCPACDGALFSVLLTAEDVENEHKWLEEFYRRRIGGEDSLKDHVSFTQGEPTHIVECQSCGTILRNPQPTPEALSRKYRFDKYGKSTLEDLLHSEMEFFRGKALAFELRPQATVLEIGSFVGAFLLSAQERGWDATGVDVGDETVEFMRSKGLNVLKGDLRTLELQPSSCDAIFIWNTFDQVAKPGELLRQCWDLLTANSPLVLRIPNGTFKRACGEASPKHEERLRLAQAYNNFLTFPYLVGYTAESIHLLLKRHGFNVQEIRGDVILPLATKDTKPEAVDEEERVKRAVMRFAKHTESLGNSILYPWLDIVAIKSQA